MMASEMQPTCPFCGNAFHDVASEEQLYRCTECRRLFRVGQSQDEAFAKEDEFEEKWKAVQSKNVLQDKTESTVDKKEIQAGLPRQPDNRRIQTDISKRVVSPLSIFYKPIGFLVAALGLLISLFIYLAGVMPGSLSGQDKVLLIAMAIVGGVFLLCGGALWKKGKKVDAQRAAKKLLEKSNKAKEAGVPQAVKKLLEVGRRPVVYFRSFVDDDITARSPDDFDFLASNPEVPLLDILPSKSEEEQVAKVFSEMGPFIALGQPGEPLPELGATRIYPNEGEWRDVVLELMQQAQLAVFRAGSTQSLAWEVRQAGKCLKPEQVVILIPKDLNYSAFTDAYKDILPWQLPSLPRKIRVCGSFFCGSLCGIVYFEPSGKSHFVPPKWLFLRTSRRKPVFAHLKTMLKPVFGQLGIRWRPPRFGYAFWVFMIFIVGPLVFFSLTGVYYSWHQRIEAAAVEAQRTKMEEQLLGLWKGDMMPLFMQYDRDGTIRITKTIGSDITSYTGRWRIETVLEDKVKIAVTWDTEPVRTETQWCTFLDSDTMIRGSPPDMEKRFVRVKENEP